MTVKKMLVVTLDDTKGVVCAVTRTASGASPVEDLVGPGLMMRMKDRDETVTVPASELTVTEVDYSEDVLRNPLDHVIDTTNTVVAPSLKVTGIARTGTTVDVTVSQAADRKTVVVVIDAGSGRVPMKFLGQSSSASPTTSVPVSGVPSGQHLILASVDGYAGSLDFL
jgi:hypothetical protein